VKEQWGKLTDQSPPPRVSRRPLGGPPVARVPGIRQQCLLDSADRALDAAEDAAAEMEP
jgi:hypothetical protein